MFILDIKTGNFYISDKIIISRDKTFNDILQLAPKNEVWDIKNGYKWIYFNKIKIEKRTFFIQVCFYKDTLFQILFEFRGLNFKEKTWDDWTEDYELKKKKEYEKWLVDNLGRKRNFNWGKISAYYDPRSGTSEISVRYYKVKD